ncbi:MAG: hypothetical protein FJ271_00450 [Planctomycetes bacterium]|nr:hypothetical protein [Planctomycetota bacterium]
MSQNDRPAPVVEQSPVARPDPATQDIPIPLPVHAPLPPPGQTRDVLERLFVILVLLLAFLLGSSPSRTSDLWLHLASGRQLLDGNAGFGVEAFTFPQDGVYWVNSSWLFDVAAYLAFEFLGGAILVVIKAALMVLLALLLLLAARGDSSNGIAAPALTTCLALLVMGPWMALRPSCISFLFIAWTIWYLERFLERPDGLSLRIWPLLVGFALWANLDRWYILGPTIVFLYFLASLVPGRAPGAKAPSTTSGERPASQQSLAWLLLCAGSLAACLLNPHHFRVFSVIGDLADAEIAAQFQVDPVLREHFRQFHDVYLSGAGARTVTAWAFWILGIGGFLSFFLSPSWPCRWGMLWAFFLVLSLLKTQAIPFFAIVGSIVLARNVCARLRERLPADCYQLQHTLGRFAMVVFLVVLAVAAWPGWSQLGPYGPRAWRVAIDPSMQALADDIVAKRQLGLQARDRVFNFSPESANYLAWLCPEVKSFVNSHLHLSGQDAATFLAVRDGLTGVILPGSAALDWRESLRKGKVGLLLIHGGESRSTTAAMSNLFRAPRECPLLALAGRAVLFGWRDPFNPVAVDPYSGLTLDMKRQAFGSAVSAVSQPGAEAYAVEPNPRMWWEAFWKARPAADVDREAVATLLTYFDAFLEDITSSTVQLGRAKEYAEFVAACGMSGPCWLLSTTQAAPNRPLMQAFLAQFDAGPIEALYLGIRSARRAIARDPTEAQLFFLLGETYDRLGRFSRERSWGSLVGNLRTSQTLAAYRQAIELDPRHWRAHERLAEIFRTMEYRDLTFFHLRESYVHRTMTRGESREQFQSRMQNLEKGLKVLENELKSLNDRWAVNSANMRVSDRADMAGNLGLPGKALETLLASDLAAFGAAGLEMELKLLLNAGEAAKVKHWLSPKHRGLLTNSTYYLIRAQSEAALGNYGDAAEALGKMDAVEMVADRPITPADLLGLAVANTLLYEASAGPGRLMPTITRFQFPGVSFLNSQVMSIVSLMQQRASNKVLQGMLAVEAGDLRQAQGAFREAAAFWNSRAGALFEESRTEASRQATRYFSSRLEAFER